MSRFTKLKYYLGFWEAIKIYWLLKTKQLKSIRLSGLQHRFMMRRNASDYGTFMEVLVKKDYTIPFDFLPKTIIDAGGNIGLTAIFFANKFPQAQIITIEPDKNNFAVLSDNISKYENVSGVNKGVWTHACFLNVVDMNQGENGFTVEEAASPGKDSIPSISIHQLKEEQGWPIIDLLKIDIEGTEKNIFEKNYEEWLPNTKVLFVETHDRLKQGCSAAVFKAVSQYNFSCMVAGENFLFVNDDLLKWKLK
jgi:FkbM family methyltransferase